MNRNIFFIVGSGRSGSTLLSRLLDGHPDLIVPPETHFHFSGLDDFKRKPFNEDSYQAFVKRFYVESVDQGWGIDSEKLLTLLKKERPQNANQAFFLICDYYSGRSEGVNKVIGLKRPSSSFFIKELLAAFPQAKFVHLVRDGRDVALSVKKLQKDVRRSWGPEGLVANALMWNATTQASGEKAHKHCTLEISYEELVEEPVKILDKITAFLEVKSCACEMLAYQSSLNVTEVTANADHQAAHSNVAKSIFGGNSMKWKTQFSAFERVQFTMIAGGSLRKYQYPLSGLNWWINLTMPVRFLFAKSFLVLVKRHYRNKRNRDRLKATIE